MQFNGPEETGQSIMNMDTNEITIDRIIGFDWKDTGTDVEDELPTPVSSPPQMYRIGARGQCKMEYSVPECILYIYACLTVCTKK